MEICQMKRFPEGEGNRLAMFSFRLAGLAVHPVGKELREELTKKAIEAYEGK